MTSMPGRFAATTRVRAWILRERTKKRRAAAAEPEEPPLDANAFCIGTVPLTIGGVLLTIGKNPTPPPPPDEGS